MYQSVHLLSVLCLSCMQSFGPESGLSPLEIFFFNAHFSIFRRLPLAEYCSYIKTAEVTGFLMGLVDFSGRNTMSQKCLFMPTGLFSPQVFYGFVRTVMPNSFTYD